MKLRPRIESAPRPATGRDPRSVGQLEQLVKQIVDAVARITSVAACAPTSVAVAARLRGRSRVKACEGRLLRQRVGEDDRGVVARRVGLLHLEERGQLPGWRDADGPEGIVQHAEGSKVRGRARRGARETTDARALNEELRAPGGESSRGRGRCGGGRRRVGGAGALVADGSHAEGRRDDHFSSRPDTEAQVRKVYWLPRESVG